MEVQEESISILALSHLISLFCILYKRVSKNFLHPINIDMHPSEFLKDIKDKVILLSLNRKKSGLRGSAIVVLEDGG